MSEPLGICQDIPTLVESLKCWHLRHLKLQSEREIQAHRIFILTQKELVRSLRRFQYLSDHRGIFWGIDLCTVIDSLAEVEAALREAAFLCSSSVMNLRTP